MSAGIELTHVRAGYGRVEAVHDLSLRVPLGATVAVVGRNGAGKSSLVRVVAGTLPVRTGHVRWLDRDVTALAPHERRRLGITVVPDPPNVFLGLTVAENLELLGGGAPPDALFDAFPELLDKLARPAATLSGGERQMLALAPVLLRPGQALLVDEPARGLSAGATDRLAGVLRQLAGPERAIVIVEQVHTGVVHRADLVYVLHRGELAWVGEPGELAAGAVPDALV